MLPEALKGDYCLECKQPILNCVCSSDDESEGFCPDCKLKWEDCECEDEGDDQSLENKPIRDKAEIVYKILEIMGNN